jgi:hypothetical protein
VISNFDAGYLDQIRCCSGKTDSFLKIPPGDDRKQTKVTQINGGPKVHYQQKEGERTCMVYSLASTIHYLGETDIASKIRNDAARYGKDLNAFRTFVQDLKKKYKIFRKELKGKHKVEEWWGTQLTGIYLTRLMGSDGKDDHCVVVTDRWIFDSNFKLALPRSKESFDLCCSSDEQKSTFVEVVEYKHFPLVTPK